MKVLDITTDELGAYQVINDDGEVMATCYEFDIANAIANTIDAHVNNGGFATAIIEIDQKRSDHKDNNGAIAGRRASLKVGGVYLNGLIHKEIEFTPTDIATLTVKMVLPEIRYVDDI